MSDDFAAADRQYWRSLKLHRLDGTIVPLPRPTLSALEKSERRFTPTSVPVARVAEHQSAYDTVRALYGAERARKPAKPRTVTGPKSSRKLEKA